MNVMASHLSLFVKLLFLLLMLARTPTIDTRPAASTAPAVDLIAGNEFLKLFLEHEETQHSAEYVDNEHRLVRGVAAQSDGISSSSSSRKHNSGNAVDRRVSQTNHYQSVHDLTAQSDETAPERSLKYKSRRSVQNEATVVKSTAGENKQLVKLVTSGSKIVFLEEYDDNDAVVDALAREIDLKKENIDAPVSQRKSKAGDVHIEQTEKNSKLSDEVKVIAVSVSSSSKRGGASSRVSNQYHAPSDTIMSKQSNKFAETRASIHHTDTNMDGEYKQTPDDKIVDKSHTDVTSMPTMKLTLTTTPATAPMTASASASSTMDDFVNRSHKSELSIEEAEPLTMSQQKLRTSQHAEHVNAPRSLHTPHAVSGRAVKMAANRDEADSANSASTNIQNVLAAPLTQSASTRTAAVTAPAAYQSRNHNHNGTSSHINHNSATVAARRAHVNTQISDDDHMTAETLMQGTSNGAAPVVAPEEDDMEEKLLPFQTVIYHNTKEGHGPQSRSISYSSLSQNVEDLHAWRHSGILAEAQRNVSESLKPLLAAQLSHSSEPAKFYSVPSKMYSEPSKFYSEPAKIYSEPAKVYGEPEKFYSEPAKVYGQPSKFYSEPSKVYSQPAKVYGEPAKTYWSTSAVGATGNAGPTSTTTTSSTASTPTTTTTTTLRPNRYMPSRRPAIVSRIAFGEAQTSTTPPPAVVADEHVPATMAVPSNHHHQQQQQQQQQQHHTHYQQHTRFHPHTQSHSHSHNYNAHNSAHGPNSSAHKHTNNQPAQPAPAQSPPSKSQSHSAAQTQPRRVLFNLDKLPYDLLNAPQQSPQHLLDPDFPHSPPAAVTYSSPRQRQCLESAFSASFSQSALQQQQQLQQQRQQHSSLSEQHSNQNAKGLPNRDLVNCVSKYQPSTATTEGSHHSNDASDNDDNHNNNDDNLYTPTPEQNYEIEESVSVMTNGRAHGVQGNVAVTTTATPTYAMRTTKFPSRGTIIHHHQQQNHYYGNANPNSNIDKNYDDDGGDDENGPNGSNGDDGVVADGNKTGSDDEDAKVAYVVEGRNYRKYRVEEKTDDGFIVGEYGVVDHNDGNLRGVRYTADSTINRSLIQKALLTFLKLK